MSGPVRVLAECDHTPTEQSGALIGQDRPAKTQPFLLQGVARLTSARVLIALAAGTGLDVEQLEQLLDPLGGVVVEVALPRSAAAAKSAQPTKSATPPIGVIAPSQRSPVNVMM